MYYTGWSQGRATPFTFFIGLMMSSDGGKTYTRYSKAPVLGRSFHDPYLTCSPFVIKENNKWRMWYVSGTGWDGTYQLALPGAPVKMKHFYHLKYAESKDGIHWDNNGQVAIDYRDKDEYAIARPILLKDQELYKMWFCYRGGTDTYRGGYAESKDGIEWSRKDQDIGLDVSATGWDSEMVCYPCVFKHKGKSYMLYNGNDYGRTGVGLAIGRDE
jgi:hypothetical protein